MKNSTAFAFCLEINVEILKLLRSPAFLLPTLLFPSLFYIFFVVFLFKSANAAYYLATYGVFSVMAPAIFGFAVQLATERNMGWLELKKIAPFPNILRVLAMIIANTISALFALILLYLLAGFIAQVHLARSIWVSLFLVHAFSIMPFILIGTIIGLLCNTNAATAIANIVFMLLAIMGGLWIPISTFPEFLLTVADYLPSYHLAQISLIISQAIQSTSLQYHLMCMLAINTILFFIVYLLTKSK